MLDNDDLGGFVVHPIAVVGLAVSTGHSIGAVAVNQLDAAFFVAGPSGHVNDLVVLPLVIYLVLHVVVHGLIGSVDAVQITAVGAIAVLIQVVCGDLQILVLDAALVEAGDIQLMLGVREAVAVGLDLGQVVHTVSIHIEGGDSSNILQAQITVNMGGIGLFKGLHQGIKPGLVFIAGEIAVFRTAPLQNRADLISDRDDIFRDVVKGEGDGIRPGAVSFGRDRDRPGFMAIAAQEIHCLQ